MKKSQSRLEYVSFMFEPGKILVDLPDRVFTDFRESTIDSINTSIKFR